MKHGIPCSLPRKSGAFLLLFNVFRMFFEKKPSAIANLYYTLMGTGQCSASFRRSVPAKVALVSANRILGIKESREA